MSPSRTCPGLFCASGIGEMPRPNEYTCPHTMLLLDYLVEKFPPSTRTTLKKMVEARRVTVNGRPAYNPKQEVTPVDNIGVRDKPQSTAHSQSPQPSRPGGGVVLMMRP